MPASSVSSSRTDMCRPAWSAWRRMRWATVKREDAVEDVDADLLVGPVVHRAERHHVGVFLLPESGFDFGLGAVGRDDVADRPGVAVGEQDAFAEDPVLQSFPGVVVGAPGQPELGGVVAGQGGGDDLAHPAGFEDRGDVGFDGVAGPAGLAAREARLQFGQSFSCFGQGLVEAAGLGGVQRR